MFLSPARQEEFQKRKVAGRCVRSLEGVRGEVRA
jgi:hypothetical protein